MADIWGGQKSTGRYGTTKKKPKGTRLWGGQVSTGRYGDPGDMRAKAAATAAAGIGVGAGAGTTKPSKTPPPKVATSQAPAPGTPDTGADQAKLISDYNLARAEILKGIAPDIQNIYGQATDSLGRVVGGVTQDVRDRLFNMGGGTAAEFNSQVDPRILASYNPDAIKNAAYTLGAAIPGEALAKQGAAFAGAAAFAPGAALQEGQYALTKAINDAKVTNADAAKVSASTSKLLGYVADAYGNPITGKDGKPVKIAAPEMTPYQKASLGLSAARLDASTKLASARIDLSKYNSDRDYALSVDKANATNSRYYAGLVFRSEQAKAAAMAKHGATDYTASTKAGYLVGKDGRPQTDKNGRLIKFTPANADGSKTGKKPSVYETQKIDETIAQWKTGGQGKKIGYHVEENPDTGAKRTVYDYAPGGAPMNYQVALRKLRTQYKMSLVDATAALDTHYQRGEQGRPWISYLEMKEYSKPKYRKWGITPKMLKTAHGGGRTKAAEDAAYAIDAILKAHGG